MTTPEAPPEVALYRIVVCDTCNVVFMVHAGRPSCPSCGGLPLMILYEGEIPTSSDEEPPPTEGEASAPAEVTAAEPAEIGPRAPSEASAPVEGQDQEAKAAAIAAPASPGSQEDI